MFDVFVRYWWQFLLVMIISAVIGSVNFAVIFSHLFKKSDIRNYGSGNPGTTNMYRVYGLRMGILTLVFDALKGVVCCIAAVLIFKGCGKDVAVTAGYIAELFVVLGHVFPVFYKLRGGKGFATSLGASFVMQPIVTLCCVLPMCLLIVVSDRMSVVALTWAAFMIIWCWTVLFKDVGAFCCLLITLTFAAVIFAHRHNIVRILTGKEHSMGVRKALRGKNKSDTNEQNENKDANE